VKFTIATPRGNFAALQFEPVRIPTSPVTALLLHGLPDYPGNFAALASALAEHGVTVIVPWLRGYAPSPTDGSFAIEDLASDIIAMAHAISPLQPIHLVGHDWGAVLTYAVAAMSPNNIITATAISVPHPLHFVQALLGRQALRSWYMAAFQFPGAAVASRARDFAFIDFLWRRWSPSFTLADQQRALLHDCLRQSWPAPLHYYRSVIRPFAAARQRLHGPLAQAITVPTLQLHGSDDRCIEPPTGSQQRYFHGRLLQKIIDGAGHFLPHESPTLCAHHIAEFIRTTST
jgi:pimeloyl-ACP methyl ester carboxylesterase